MHDGRSFSSVYRQFRECGTLCVFACDVWQYITGGFFHYSRQTIKNKKDNGVPMPVPYQAIKAELHALIP
jgi:hypothetical protein